MKERLNYNLQLRLNRESYNLLSILSDNLNLSLSTTARLLLNGRLEEIRIKGIKNFKIEFVKFR